jgi:iron(III) transport system ATP-binding protein
MQAGRVQQEGSPFEIYARPANRFVADFIGRVNFLEGRVVAVEGELTRLDVRGVILEVPSPAAPLSAGHPATLVVRPETIHLAPTATAEPSAFRGTIRRAVYLGSTIEYEIEWGKTTILAVIGSPLEHGILAEGEAVAFNFPPGTTHLLPGAA